MMARDMLFFQQPFSFILFYFFRKTCFGTDTYMSIMDEAAAQLEYPIIHVRSRFTSVTLHTWLMIFRVGLTSTDTATALLGGSYCLTVPGMRPCLNSWGWRVEGGGRRKEEGGVTVWRGRLKKKKGQIINYRITISDMMYFAILRFWIRRAKEVGRLCWYGPHDVLKIYYITCPSWPWVRTMELRVFILRKTQQLWMVLYRFRRTYMAWHYMTWIERVLSGLSIAIYLSTLLISIYLAFWYITYPVFPSVHPVGFDIFFFAVLLTYLVLFEILKII